MGALHVAADDAADIRVDRGTVGEVAVVGGLGAVGVGALGAPAEAIVAVADRARAVVDLRQLVDLSRSFA